MNRDDKIGLFVICCIVFLIISCIIGIFTAETSMDRYRFIANWTKLSPEITQYIELSRANGQISRWEYDEIAMMAKKYFHDKKINKIFQDPNTSPKIEK